MKEIELSMSNFDHEIDDGFEKALKEKPNKVCGTHAGWDFYGKVFYDGEQFCEEVWVYGSVIETIKANNLEDLMSAVNDKYGWE